MNDDNEIDPGDIRKGDTIRKVYTSAPDIARYLSAIEYVAVADGNDWDSKKGVYYLIARPLPALPTEPGYYRDNEGGVWYRQTTGANNGNHWKDGAEERHTDGVARNFAPFTLLRPVAEVVREVLEDVRNSILTGAQLEHGKGQEVTIPMTRNLKTIAARFGVEL